VVRGNLAKELKPTRNSEKAKKREGEGVLSKDFDEKKKRKKKGELIAEAMNRGMLNFTPEMIFEKMVSNYKLAEQLLGKNIIREISDFSNDYIEKNIRIPEFQKEILKRINKNIEELKRDGFLDKESMINDSGIELSLIEDYLKNLEKSKLLPSSGERQHKKIRGFDIKAVSPNRKELFKDLILTKTVHNALKREHKSIEEKDIVWAERKRKANMEIIFALDTSASMRGKKIYYSKMAALGLSYWAIRHSDKVGLINFSKEIESVIEPTQDFKRIAMAIAKVLPKGQTDISLPMEECSKIVRHNEEKELIMISDAMHTSSRNSEKAVIDSAYKARDIGLRVSIVGISLKEDGRRLARRICDITGGHLYDIKLVKDIPVVVIADYLNERYN